jgi:ATP-dependent RNA helicase RhlE
VPLPENFVAEKNSLPKPVQAAPTAQRRFDDARGHSHNNGGARRDSEQPKRRFPPKRRNGVGAHKGAVQRTGAR